MNAVKHYVALEAGVRFIPGALPMGCGAMPRVDLACFLCIFATVWREGGMDTYELDMSLSSRLKSTPVVFVTL